ncbi:MAG: hypothetical protein R3E88_20340 [Myxococcota bacterium]
MRNPFRRKLMQARFLPFAAGGGLALAAAAPSRALVALGVALVAAGVALRTWAAGHLEKREILAVSGPYARLRHPLYAGTLAISLGIAAVLGGVGSALAAALLAAWFVGSYFPRKERSESDALEARFGGAFTAYRARVPALWPARRSYAPSREVASSVDLSTGWTARRYADNHELATLAAVALALGVALLRVRALLGAP